jgi:hypothetical protein
LSTPFHQAFVAVSASPNARAQGINKNVILIGGAGFQPGVRAKVSGSGVTVNSTTRLSETSLQLTVSVDSSAPVGARDIVITNPGPVATTCFGCFTVNARPTVTSATSSSLPRGASNRTIRVTGTGFQDGAAASFNRTGVTVNGVSYVDSTRIDLDVSIAMSAPTGGRSITVVNPDGGTVTRSGMVTVNALPKINSTSPSILHRETASTWWSTDPTSLPTSSPTAAAFRSAPASASRR